METREMNASPLNRRQALGLFGSLGLAAFVHAEPRDRDEPHPERESKYAQQVLSLKPVGYWRLQEKSGKIAHDASPYRSHADYHGRPGFQKSGPVGRGFSVEFDGKRTYVEIPSHADFSIATHKHGMTVEAWMQPARLTFPGEPEKDYLHWLAKGGKDAE